MIKRLYLANGTLQTPLSKTAEDISVDAGLASYMLSVLSIGDWAYLTVEFMGRLEVIKVYLDYSGLGVVRAQDGTCRQGFPVGANVVYKITQAEIIDASPASDVRVYADGVSAITVTGNWVVNYSPVMAQTEGGIRAYFSLADATLHLDSWYPAAGCLSIAGNGAPLIGGPFFYLTSQLYPVDYTESAMAADPNARKHLPGSGFGPGPMWTLTQPFLTEGAMYGYAASLGGINTFGSEGSVQITDSAMTANVGMGALNTWGTEGGFTLKDTSAMAGNAYILQMLLFGNEVDYTYGVDQYMASKAIGITSITVS